MLNVNYGHNKELMEVCKPLKEYSWFVEEIRQNHKMKMEIGMAVDAALDHMPEDFAIRQFLLDNRAEVKDVFLTEYNEQKTMAAFRDEYIAEGLEKGLVKGRVEGEESKANSIALTLLKRGKDTIEDIALITGLSVDTVKALAAQNHVLDA
jgi:predicted transposase YdaD